MARPLIVGVMGGARAEAADLQAAYRLGALIAAQGWVLLNGGRGTGIMDASARGAAEAGGLTIGVLPDADRAHASEHIRVAVCTGMGSARNTINVLSSDIVVACAGGAGTLSEIALALKHGKRVITLGFEAAGIRGLLGPDIALDAAQSPEAVIRLIQTHCRCK
ncbi:TIGR00725 family protein [Desulfatitalea alkaliphila]|uniref:TIGR00725 family protein n=1 Tax=Desulfatitalea alkaliphila TaxID=2929485 RepID=A0AA41UIY5_9BACT|nr:TIGR00725 family protein [Desulfatitalea alkaliphila]MCJ8500594.1 TIGR00725 family protein [Desulfatitalea alkaliphila]